MSTNLESSAVVTELKKVSFHSNFKERQCQECSNYCTIVLISHANKVMLKNFQATWEQYVNWEFPDLKDEFRNSKESEIKVSTFIVS